MAEWQLPVDVVLWIAQLSQPLHARLAWRLLPLIGGMLFASGRRTVASWLRAGRLGDDYRAYYYFLGSLGHNVKFVASLLLRRVVSVIEPGDRLLFGLDDTPTKLTQMPLPSARSMTLSRTASRPPSATTIPDERVPVTTVFSTALPPG